MKIIITNIVILVSLTTTIFATETNKKITYFPLQHPGVGESYTFLATSLPRSFRAVLTRKNFSTVDHKDKTIENVKARETIVNLGKEINTDIIVCGTFSIDDSKGTEFIKLIIYVYDIEGGERVIEKLIIGKTGTAMFEMIDQTSDIISNSLLDYFEKRDKLLAEAKKRREELQALNEQERLLREKEFLETGTIKTRFNTSMYLDSHVARYNELKIFFYTVYEYTNYEIKNFMDTYADNLFSNLSLSYGLGKEIEIKLDMGIMFYHYTESYEVDGLNERTNKNVLFNPIIGIKWRALRDENHGLNLSLYFGMQFSLADKFYGGTIMHPLRMVSMHMFHIGIFIDKTIGIFTPFFTFQISPAKRLNGGLHASNLYSPEYDEIINGFRANGTSGWVTFNISIGTEIRIAGWFIIQPKLTYYYTGSYKTDYTSLNKVKYEEIGSANVLIPEINLIFKLGRGIALALDFQYAIFLNKLSWLYNDSITTYNSEIIFNTTFKVFLYIAAPISF